MTTEEDPIERKVQLTGGSTFTVSLPKEWAQDQHIEAGSTLTLFARGNQLVLTSAEAMAETTKRATIDATARDSASLALDIGAAYVAGCDEITVTGLHNTADRRAVTRAIRGFVGLEVMSEDEQQLTARTMLDSADISPAQTMSQLERTTLDMHEQAIEAVTTADGERGALAARNDDTVDRLFALLSREFQLSLVDPGASLSRNGVSSFEYYMAARQLERIADHAEKIALIADRFEEAPPEEIAESLTSYGARARALVSDSLAGVFEDSGDLIQVREAASSVLADTEAFDETLYHSDRTEGYLLSVVLDSIVRTVQYSVNIAEIGLQAQYRNADSE